VTLRRYFPTLIRFENMLRGRILLRVLLAFVVLIFAMTTIVRIHSFVLTRRMERVIAGLSKLQIDQSTEEDVKLAMPQLVRWQSDGQLERSHETGDIDIGIEKGYSVSISNESGWMKFGGLISPITSCCVNTTHTKDGYEHNWILALANLLGYRYVNFSASVVLLNGRVSSISYGIQDRLVFPRQAGTIVGVKSAHSFWAPYRTGFEVSSMDDESPQFRVSKGEHNLGVSYTTDAPSELKAHASRFGSPVSGASAAAVPHARLHLCFPKTPNAYNKMPLLAWEAPILARPNCIGPLQVLGRYECFPD